MSVEQGSDPAQQGVEASSQNQPEKTGVLDEIKGLVNPEQREKAMDWIKTNLLERKLEDNDRKDAKEVLQKGPLNQEQIINAVAKLSYEDQRMARLEGKYGKGLTSGIRKLLNAELDIKVDEKGEAKWNVLAEVSRKAMYSVFNRRTMAATAVGVGLGMLTGGIGFASLGVIYGGIAGRATAEGISVWKGGERNARAEMMQQEHLAWNHAKELVGQFKKTSDSSEKAELIEQINAIYFGKDKEVLEAKENLGKEEASLNKSRNRWQKMGELVGGVAGIGHAFLSGKFGGLDLDLWNKVPGDQIYHQVVNNGTGWNYVVGMNEGLTNAASSFNGQVIHALKEPAWKIIAASAGEQVLPVLTAAAAGAFFGKKLETKIKAGGEKKEEKKQAKFEKATNTKVVGGERGVSSEPNSESKTPEEILNQKIEKWQNYAYEQGLGKLPRIGENWAWFNVKKGGPEGEATISEIDWNSEPPRVIFIDQRRDISNILFKGERSLPIDHFLKNLIKGGRVEEKKENTEKEKEEEVQKNELESTNEATPPGTMSAESLEEFARREELESKKVYEDSLDKAIETLKGTEGIVELKRDVPTVIIPDLHARREFLSGLLNQTDENGNKIYDLLKEGKINIVCLGDGMHSENGLNWIDKKVPKPERLKAEMIRSLGMMKMIMDLKVAFPDSFHYLKGNHDDVMGGFYKFDNESEDVRNWIIAEFGQDFLQKYALFEKELPILAVGNGFVASHAAPSGEYSRESLAKRDHNVVEKFTWTDNTKGETNEEYIDKTLINIGAAGDRWIIGHRPVSENQGRFREQFSGKLIQINNRREEMYMVIPADGKIVPNEDVKKLG